MALQDDGCGYYITDLCGESGSDCVQEDSTAEVVMPEPIAGYSGDAYRVRIAEVGTDKAYCSDDFYLMSSADAALVEGAGGASLEVVAPNSDSMAVSGEEYTIEVGLKKNQNAPRPSEHPPVREEKCQNV